MVQPDLARLSTLPPELIATICKQADRSCQKNLRLASKAFNHVTEAELFRTCYLKVNIPSYRRLKHIASAAHLRPHVRHLVYDGRLLPWHLELYSDWKSYIFGARETHGYKLIDLSRKEHTKSDDDQLIALQSLTKELGHRELRTHYDKYLRRLSEQKDLHRGTEEVDRLSALFKAFHNLTSVELDTGIFGDKDKRVVSNFIGSWEPALEETLSQIGYETLIEPSFSCSSKAASGDHRNNFHMKRLLAIGAACQASGKSLEILSAGFLDTYMMLEKVAQPFDLGIKTLLGSLSYLRLSIMDFHMIYCDKVYHDDVRNANIVLALVKEAVNLKELYLQGSGDIYEDVFRMYRNHPDARPALKEARDRLLGHQYFNLDGIGNIQLPKLCMLRLDGCLWLEKGSFMGFLERHALTLRELDLSDLLLSARTSEDSDRSLEKYPPSDRERKDGSWLVIFNLLAQRLTLSHVSLHGMLGNLQNENWMITTDRAISESSAKRRVIRWILRRGDNPFPGIVEDETFYAYEDLMAKKRLED